MNCEYCHEYCRDCDGSRTHYISLKGMELVGCGCSACCDHLGGSGPYLREVCKRCEEPGEIIGGICGSCADDLREEAKAEAAMAYFDARFDAKVEAAARNDRAFWGLG